MKDEFLFVKAKKKLHKVNLAEIVYIEAMDDYIRFKLKEEKILVARMTMKYMLEQLDPKSFIRVHRSFIVPLRNIEAVGTKSISVDGNEIALGKIYAEHVREQFQNCG